jgi:hypothetical protein
LIFSKCHIFFIFNNPHDLNDATIDQSDIRGSEPPDESL